MYDIEMISSTDSQEIRDAFGLFWRKKSGKKMPTELKGVSLSNVTTFPTRVRVRLLKEVCRRHQSANPDLSCFVTNYLPRPELKIRDRKGPMLSYNYTETVQKLSHHLTTDFLADLSKFARANLSDEEIKDRFLVLSPDFINPPVHSASSSMAMAVDESPLGDPNPSSLPTGPDTATANLSAQQVNSWADDLTSQAASPGSSTLSQNPNQAGSESDADALKKRNRDRYLKKTAPY